MLTNRNLRFFFLTVLLNVTGFSQSRPQTAPVPSDSYELVTGATQVPSTPEERSAVLDLLERARQNADLHAPGGAAFSLHVTFNASGNVHATGSGDMEETWLGPAT